MFSSAQDRNMRGGKLLISSTHVFLVSRNSSKRELYIRHSVSKLLIIPPCFKIVIRNG